jgi:hypothetical protein
MFRSSIKCIEETLSDGTGSEARLSVPFRTSHDFVMVCSPKHDSAHVRPMGTVLNGTVLLRLKCHHGCSMKKKAKRKFGDATRASVKKEMAKPRMSKSAREEETKRADARIARRMLRKSK